METPQALQDKYAPHSICFGCGPANDKGLRIKSVADETTGIVTAEWLAKSHHEAFPGMLNGGIVGALLDCHSNWTAAWHLMRKNNLSEPPCTVTAKFAVELLKPTPSGQTLKLVAQVKESTDRKAVVDAQLICGEEVCATCNGTFIAVKPGHPAYHRWG